MFARPSVIEKHVSCFARVLGLDAARILEWGFAQAVLSAIWAVEDGHPTESYLPSIDLGQAILTMLGKHA